MEMKPNVVNDMSIMGHQWFTALWNEIPLMWML